MNYPNIDIITERQPVKIIRLSLLPVLVLLLLAFPKQSQAQSFNPLISFSVESCTLDKALEKLFAEYELNVAFSKAELSKIRIESYSCSYKSVEEVLSDLLKGTEYGFKKIGRQYVIKKNQLLVNEPDATITPPADTPIEIVKPKTDTVVPKAGEVVRVYDTVQVIRTVMRYDTVVQIQKEVKTDTVYQVKYQGWQIPWPKFRNNGWFITPSVALCSAAFRYGEAEPEPNNGSVDVVPSFAYGIGLDGGYKYQRLTVGMNLSYRSVRYRFLLEQTTFSGDYYVNDTLDSYYTIHPSGDTTYQYILDSTYVPLTTTHFAYRDINRLDYLGVGVFAAFDFVKSEHFRAFAKAGVSFDFLVGQSGSLYAAEPPFHAPIAKEQVEPSRISYYGGLGVALKVAHRIELVPEVHYRVTHGSLYRADFPFDMKMRTWDFRLGLTYYF